MKEEFNPTTERVLLDENLKIIEEFYEELGSKQKEVEECKKEIFFQQSNMMEIIKALKIENHNLRDKIIQLEGMMSVNFKS
ncbi:hypothetical protein UFOVP270_13 [uncultured Caudovirales phage]|uniref:Uncharacterized protein n=1 Tax=uncultured Caudovirales phage TaxID=2100421 RepID=A0A6J5L773_9CAUD|nr:hypothetical protein UFOVP101_43 [uncultured Caudovirales phage]CAB4134073.1 hypothetical protein UFOVP270_13 [uncultured Caudovirales phage]